MSDQRWRRIEEICHEVLERPLDERALFVREACAGDAALCVEVESLLANQSRAEALGWGLGIGDFGLHLIGKQFGISRIVSLLGAGGMGEVYRARRAEHRRNAEALNVSVRTVKRDWTMAKLWLLRKLRKK